MTILNFVHCLILQFSFSQFYMKRLCNNFKILKSKTPQSLQRYTVLQFLYNLPITAVLYTDFVCCGLQWFYNKIEFQIVTSVRIKKKTFVKGKYVSVFYPVQCATNKKSSQPDNRHSLHRFHIKYNK